MVEIKKIHKHLKKRIFLEIIILLLIFHFFNFKNIPLYQMNSAQGHHMIAKSLMNEGNT